MGTFRGKGILTLFLWGKRNKEGLRNVAFADREVKNQDNMK